MTANLGKFDRVARLVAAALLLVAAFGTDVAGSGILFWLALMVAAILMLTAAVRSCPVYSVIGLKTCGDRS